MRKEKRREARGVTLIELMVAVVLLAIVVMFIATIPTLSQRRIWTSNMVSGATGGARDKMEQFRSVLARTGPTYSGYDTLKKYNNVTRTDTFVQTEVRVVRRWIFTTYNPDSGKGRMVLWCIPLDGTQRSVDSLRFEVWFAKRDTLPPLGP
jgi:prepilin-type N-terminal cleavage/methylation domain-containing protein